jgi:hypothetical protein
MKFPPPIVVTNLYLVTYGFQFLHHKIINILYVEYTYYRFPRKTIGFIEMAEEEIANSLPAFAV